MEAQRATQHFEFMFQSWLLVVLHPPTNVLASLDENHSTSEMEFIVDVDDDGQIFHFYFPKSNELNTTFSLHFKITETTFMYLNV